MRERRRPGVAGVVGVGREELGGQVGAAQVLQVHGQEGDVGERVAQTQAVVELQAVEDPRPVVEQEDVVGQQVSVPVDRAARRDPSSKRWARPAR